MDTWWDQKGSEAFYRNIHAGRPQTHEAFCLWEASLDLPRPRKILEIGCGASVFYTKHFEQESYTGLDISQAVTEWNLAHGTKSHRFVASDIVKCTEDDGAFDLVFSLAAVDHVPDVPAFVGSCIRKIRPGGWLYLNSYRGWFPDLVEHRYNRDPGDGCYYNDLSPSLLDRQMKALGLEGSVKPGVVCVPSIGPECLVIARSPLRHGG
jgi:SAM-dependent methyltransferase